MKMSFLVLGFLLLGLITFLCWSSFPWGLKEKVILGEVIHVEPEGMVNNEERPNVIKIQTWNLSFLYGEGSEGPGYVPKERKFYEEKLDLLAEEIRASGPDVLCLQEIDFESKRSFDINQAQILARKANYPYVAEAMSWEANYIPFPYWPITRHFGRMRSGGAILSKYPILSNQIHLLDKPLSRPWWYNIFYLYRYLQHVTIEFGDHKISLVNVHLEAFDKENRKNQIEILVNKVKKEKIDFVVGDFNMVPTVATKKSKFSRYDDDYENDTSFERMLESELLEVIPDSIYTQNEENYFTFPASRPDRRLDYIFYQSHLKMIKAEVLPSAISDHLPLRASFQISDPDFNQYSQ